MSEIHRAHVADIDPVALYRILWLRVSVFVVEQQAAYPEIDGRDLEPGAELMWIVEDDEVLATLRILCGDARGRGLAARLMEAAIERCAHLARDLPIDLDAQLQLEQWYGRFGFVRTGDAYQEDGIPHIPMRRSAGDDPDAQTSAAGADA